MRLIWQIVALLLLLAVLAYAVMFALENTDRVGLSLVFWQLPARSVGLWMILAFATGGLCGLLISWLASLRSQGRQWTLRRRVRKLEQQAPTRTASAPGR